jgi:hypothetical protein
MRIRNFIIADAVAPGLEGKTFVHGGGVSAIAAPQFPYVHPRLGLMITLVYESPEDDIPHRLKVVIENDAADEIAVPVDSEIPAPPESFETREGFRLIHLLGDIAGLLFEEPGRYWVALRVDDNELDRMVLEVAVLGG